MWGRTMWLALIFFGVGLSDCHVVYHDSNGGTAVSQDGGEEDLGQYHLQDENANGRNVWNQTVHSSPGTGGRLKHQSPNAIPDTSGKVKRQSPIAVPDTGGRIKRQSRSPIPVPDINIIYKFKEGTRTGADPHELSCNTGDLSLTLETDVVPSYSRSLQFPGHGHVRTATLGLPGIQTKGVMCKADTDTNSFYSASAPLLPTDAKYVPEALSITISKLQDVKVNFESVSGTEEVLWNKVAGRSTESDRKRGRIIGGSLTIPYRQLDGSGIYEIGEYSDAPGYKPASGTTGIISLLERDCPEGKYGSPACSSWCKDCMYGGVCHDHTGECICLPGLSGDYCETRCQDGYIGRNCGILAGSVELTAVCLPHPLGCHCLPGYKGFKCKERCQSYEWGIDCSKRCDGNCLYSCDKLTGKCSHNQPSVCDQGERGLPRLRKPPTVTNTSTGNIRVQFLAWNSSNDDGEMFLSDELWYQLQYWPESNSQGIQTKDVTPPSTELTDLIPLTQYNMKVLVGVTRSGQSCVEHGSFRGRVHTLPFMTPCPTNGQPPPANLRFDVTSNSASIHWDVVAYVKECEYRYHLTITPASGQQPLVTEETQLTTRNVNRLDPNTKYTVDMMVVDLVSVQGLFRATSISNVNTLSFTTLPPKPVIVSKITRTRVFFTISEPAGPQDNLQYRYQLQDDRKACSSGRTPSWSSWSRWLPWSGASTTVFNKQKKDVAYSKQTLRAMFWNIAGEGSVVEESLEVPDAVPQSDILSLHCEDDQPHTCFVRLETNCRKENGPGLTISYDLLEDGKQQPVGTWRLHPSSVDNRGQAYIPTHLNILPPYTWITMRAYSTNSAGRNPNSMKTDHFRTPPAKPGKVSNMRNQTASESITVTWEKPLDNPVRGELEGYKVEWKMESIGHWNAGNVKYLDSNTHWHTITNLTNDIVYQIRVSAKNKGVEEYGNYMQVSATPKKGKPSPVTNLMVVNETQTSLIIAWREPTNPSGNIEKYIVNLVKDADENIVISSNVTEKMYEFTDLQEGSAYTADVRVCNNKFCSDPVVQKQMFWTRPAEPEVRGEPKVESSSYSSVTIQLPILDNPPGYQVILLKNFNAGEYSDDESHKSLEKEATDLVNKAELQSGSDRRRRAVNDVEYSKTIRVVAQISQHEGNLTDKFTVGDNKTYGNYKNEPLEKNSTHWMVVVTERKAGPHNALNVSPPIKIQAVPECPTTAYVSALISLLLLVILVMLVGVVIFYRKECRRSTTCCKMG